MRLIFATFLALALSLLPAGVARAASASQPAHAAAAAMPCHGMAPIPTPDDDRQACADHCLSQVNGFAILARLSPPSLHNAINADPSNAGAVGKLRLREPPDPPPPRAGS